MSKTIAGVLALALGAPIIILIAVVSAGGVDPGFLTGTLTFVVVVAAVIAMFFEIKRLADS